MSTETAKMRAWQVEASGRPSQIAEIARPKPAPGEVLVQIAAAGLNFADLLMEQGRYQVRNPLPFTAGMELAGTVVEQGPGCSAFPPGSRVAAHVRSGAFAEFATVPEADLLLLPPEMPLSLAAGFQIAWGTSHLALHHQAALQKGETLFVTGASGGVGLTAVSIGKLLGARVIASVRGEDKARIAREAGADLVIDSDTEDLRKALRDAGGLDVTYDTVGGAAFDAALRETRPGGRMLAIGFAGGEVPNVALNQLLVRNISVHGLWYGGYLNFAPQILRDSLATLITWWREGRITPLIAAELPFEDLQKGLAMIRNREVSGKLVLRTEAG